MPSDIATLIDFKFIGIRFWITILIVQASIGLAIIAFPYPLLLLLTLGLFILIPLLYARPILAFGLILVSVPSYNLVFFQIGKVDIRPNDIAIFIGVLALVFQWIKKRKFEIDLGRLDILLLIMFGWVLLSNFWTPVHSMGLFQSLKIFNALLIYFVMVNLIKTEKEFEKAVFIWFFIGAFWAVAGLMSVYFRSIPAASNLEIIGGTLPHLGKTVRASTFFGGPNDYGFALSIMTMMAILYFETSPSRFGKIFAVGIIFAMIIVLIGTFARKSWLGLALSIFILGLRKRNMLLMLGMAFLLSMGFILLFGSQEYSEALLNRVASFWLEPEVSISERTISWSVARQLFMQSPVIGQGVGSFFILGPQHGSPLNIPHSFYWYLLSEYGLMGMLVFFLFVLNSAYYLVHSFKNSPDSKHKAIALILLATMISIIFQSAFKTIGLTEPLFWAFWALMSIYLKVHRPVLKRRAANPA